MDFYFHCAARHEAGRCSLSPHLCGLLLDDYCPDLPPPRRSKTILMPEILPRFEVISRNGARTRPQNGMPATVSRSGHQGRSGWTTPHSHARPCMPCPALLHWAGLLSLRGLLLIRTKKSVPVQPRPQYPPGRHIYGDIARRLKADGDSSKWCFEIGARYENVVAFIRHSPYRSAGFSCGMAMPYHFARRFMITMNAFQGLSLRYDGYSRRRRSRHSLSLTSHVQPFDA